MDELFPLNGSLEAGEPVAPLDATLAVDVIVPLFPRIRTLTITVRDSPALRIPMLHVMVGVTVPTGGGQLPLLEL